MKWGRDLFILAIGLLIGFIAGLAFYPYKAGARDAEGKYANSPLKSWFDQLASGKGLCCSFADGVSVQDVDWSQSCKTVLDITGEEKRDCHYTVTLHGQVIEVPESAVVTEPNRFGPAVVWPYMDTNGATQIRCFLPGAGA